jgi:lysozyme
MKYLLFFLALAFLVYQELKTQDSPAVEYIPQQRIFAPINPIEKKESDELLSLIKSFEGFSPTVYKCQAGVDTIGYGFTDPKIVQKGFITEQEASLLLKDVVNKHSSYVDSLVKVELTKEQKIALTSFSFNCGKENLKNITARINKGKIEEAAKAILLYVKANGEVSKGLQKRRKMEYELFISA